MKVDCSAWAYAGEDGYVGLGGYEGLFVDDFGGGSSGQMLSFQQQMEDFTVAVVNWLDGVVQGQKPEEGPGIDISSRPTHTDQAKGAGNAIWEAWAAWKKARKSSKPANPAPIQTETPTLEPTPTKGPISPPEQDQGETLPPEPLEESASSGYSARPHPLGSQGQAHLAALAPASSQDKVALPEAVADFFQDLFAKIRAIWNPGGRQETLAGLSDPPQRLAAANDETVISKTTYYVNPYYEVEQPDTLALSVEVTSTVPNEYTYRTFDNTTTYTIQSGDVLEFDVYMDSANPQFMGGLDAMLSVSGTVRDHSGWVDQNGLSIHPGAGLRNYANGQWYHRTFAIGNKAGETLSNFKILSEGDVAGYYVVLLDNVKITNGGSLQRMIYQDGFPSASVQAEGPTTGIVYQTMNRSTSYYTVNGQRAEQEVPVAMRKAGFVGDNGLKWMLSDHLGSTSVVANVSGASPATQGYMPWGETRYGSVPTSYQYTGQFNETAIGVYWYGSRWYDPYITQFTVHPTRFHYTRPIQFS